MTLKDCYLLIEGDYEDVLSRLRSERLVQKFIFRFLEDKSYELFCTSMKEKNYEEAFRAAHTIKGICQNLSFNGLISVSVEMTEALRHGYTPRADELRDQFDEAYHKTVNGILKYKAEIEG